MRGSLKLACLTALGCALCAVFASSAFAFTGSTYAPYQYPVVPPTVPTADASLMAGSNIKAQDGWEDVYLTGGAYQRGFQFGFLTAQSADYYIQMYVYGTSGMTFPSGTDGTVAPVKSAGVIADECIAGYTIWPLIPVEYQQELEGIADGMNAWYAAQGEICPDNLWDVVCSNAWSELGSGAYTYSGTDKTPPTIPASPSHGPEQVPEVSQSVQAAEASSVISPSHAGDRCSAFIATGSAWTTDSKPVMGHDTWAAWSENFEYNFMVYVHPTDDSGNPVGYDYAYQTCGGNIWSGQDWYENSSGLMITETTLSDKAFNPNGVPIFVRAAEATQYASTCNQAVFGVDVTNAYTADDTAAQGGDGAGGCVMGFQAGTSRSNGGYCNEWLIGDSTGKIASLILGALSYDLHETTNGMFGSCNYSWGPNVNYESSIGVPVANGTGTVAAGTPPARWNRWVQIEAKYEGKKAINAQVAMQIQGDDFDTSIGLAHHGDSSCITGSSSIPYPAAPAHYGTNTALTGIPPSTATTAASNTSATTTQYYPAYAGLTAAKTSDSNDYDGKVTTESMVTSGLQMMARWGYASGANFFGEPYPQNETDYFAAHPITATVAAATVPGASESGSTVTITTTAANAVVSTGGTAAGANATISGVGVAGYNGTFAVTVVSPTQFTYTDPNTGLAASGGGSVSQAESPATTQKAWELNAMLPIAGSGPNGNALPWTLLGEAASVSGVPAPSISGNVNSYGWSSQPVTLTFNTQGSWTGASIMYKVDAGSWTAGTSVTIPAPANGSNDGVHTVQYYAVSGSNDSATQSCTVQIDSQAPTTTATNAPTGWVKSSSVTVNLQATDTGSGVATDWYPTGTYNDGTDGTLPLYQWGPMTWYSVDSGAWTEGTQPTVSGDGVHTISFYSTDNAGNKETAKNVTVEIDATAPTLTASGLQTSTDSGWRNSDQTVTLTPNDAGSGVAATYYTIDGGATQTYTAPFSVSGAGSHTVTYWATDSAGNASQLQSGYVNIDTTSPTLTASGLQASTDSGWCNSAQSVSLTPNDAGSGVAATYYTIDGGTTQTYTVPFSVSGAGNHTVDCWTVDAAGNSSATLVGYVNIDTGKPVVTALKNVTVKKGKTATLKCKMSDPAPSCGVCSVTITISRKGKVVKTLTYANVELYGTHSYAVKATFKKGTYTWTMRATDIAGNASKASSKSLKVT